jgi:uncharacterized ParB-like nuclease family protein
MIKLKNLLSEALKDTWWQNDFGKKVTLKQLLNVIKDYPTINVPLEKISGIVLKKDSGGIESDRLDAAELKYPILIIVDDNNNYKYILDGNHRANKAIKLGAKTIAAKLINPKNLPTNFQNLF